MRVLALRGDHNDQLRIEDGCSLLACTEVSAYPNDTRFSGRVLLRYEYLEALSWSHLRRKNGLTYCINLIRGDRVVVELAAAARALSGCARTEPAIPDVGAEAEGEPIADDGVPLYSSVHPQLLTALGIEPGRKFVSQHGVHYKASESSDDGFGIGQFTIGVYPTSEEATEASTIWSSSFQCPEQAGN